MKTPILFWGVWFKGLEWNLTPLDTKFLTLVFDMTFLGKELGISGYQVPPPSKELEPPQPQGGSFTQPLGSNLFLLLKKEKSSQKLFGP